MYFIGWIKIVRLLIWDLNFKILIFKQYTIENSNKSKTVSRHGIYMYYICLERENTVNYLKN